MTVYILEWGYDSCYTSTENNMKDVFSTVDEAKAKALSYSYEVRPIIYMYDLDNHRIIKKINDDEEDHINIKKVKVSVDDNVYYDDIDIPF